jgi:hypothetical protein
MHQLAGWRRLWLFWFVLLQWLTMSNQSEPAANIAVSCTRGNERRGDDG